MDNILLYFAIKYEGDWDKIYQAINKKEKIDPKQLEEVIAKNKDNFITLISNDYPLKLKNIYKPPFVLFYKGDKNLLYDKGVNIGVVGSRKHTEYGKKVTEKLVKDLVDRKVTIISGLAKGIDSISHNIALDNNGKTIAVLGNGLDVYYPNENKKLQDRIADNGLLISEYPCFKDASKENFPKRNRIIAALSDGILVTEANNRSGSMITVSRALEMGKEIFCVPNEIDKGSGCNTLIKEGAKLVETVNDILLEL